MPDHWDGLLRKWMKFQMAWILVGYFPKKRVTRSHWVSPYPDYPKAEFPAPAPVEELCSVSRCIAKGPDTPFDEVPFNEFGGYDSVSSACRAVPRDMQSDFDLYAYRLGSGLFRDGIAEPLELSCLQT